MAIMRLFGLWMFLMAMISVAVDGTKSLAANKLEVTSLEEFWHSLHRSSYIGIQKIMEAQFPSFVRDVFVNPVFFSPLWLVLGVLGVLFYWLGRKRRRTSVYVN